MAPPPTSSVLGSSCAGDAQPAALGQRARSASVPAASAGARAARASAESASTAVCYVCCDNDAELLPELTVGSICGCASLAIHVRPCLESLVNHHSKMALTTSARLSCLVCLQAYRLPFRLEPRDTADAPPGSLPPAPPGLEGAGAGARRSPWFRLRAPVECPPSAATCRWALIALLSGLIAGLALGLSVADVSFEVASIVMLSVGVVLAAALQVLLRKTAAAAAIAQAAARVAPAPAGGAAGGDAAEPAPLIRFEQGGRPRKGRKRSGASSGSHRGGARSRSGSAQGGGGRDGGGIGSARAFGRSGRTAPADEVWPASARGGGAIGAEMAPLEPAVQPAAAADRAADLEAGRAEAEA